MDSETKNYPVLAGLRHNGKRYEPGESVEMTEAQAETLQALGILSEATTLKGILRNKGALDLTPAERVAEIKDTILALDPESDFNKDGTPKVKAVELLTGFDVSADEVKALHAELKAEADTKTGVQA
ncbi:hypothetical protein [Pseudovibrio sp. Tun.PSC04-5.I4]|uniref:DUF7210 family protein n=1 Tax=Pseudovibrio sp. Tun.PSC04-5.I4 TaxID=1798213 RepID=UPI0008846BC8|nr:hypothetical protein [Pseudovibrio sp. Tun.PSC04-5.I4]SDR15612.1 hypothetical protein SAMN04515695_3063 [Pseudovibrio sp. Tun.PSC04-5.I4]